jgi:hypothetical protein
MGVIVNETNMLMRIAKPTVKPNELKNRPMRPCMKATGIKITSSDTVVATTAEAISEVAERAASIAERPNSSMCRKMFSCTTTASSITMPMARIKPSIVMLFSEKPIYDMKAKVGIIDMGIANVAMIVVRQSRMKTRIVRLTRIAGQNQMEFHLFNRGFDEPRLVANNDGLDIARQQRRNLA